MKAAFPSSAFLCRKIGAALLAVSALLFNGCDSANIADFLLDPEPVQGTYQVTVSPSDVELTVLNSSAVVTLTAVGVGSHLPPNLGQNQPNWQVGISGPFHAVVGDPNSPSTTVTITYTGDPNPSSEGKDQEWNRYFIDGSLSAKATNVPDGMKATSASLNARYYFGPDVEDEIAETPRLTILPARVSFLPGTTRVLTVTYKGPNATVSSGGVSPSGQGFSLNMSPPALKDGVSFQASISYFPTTGDPGSGHFTLTTSNGATAAVPLTGLSSPP